MAAQRPRTLFARACPCGTGAAYDDCCGPLHRQERAAGGVEELMRSRYSAYAVGETDHLYRTWHPRTRPADLSADPAITWTGLEILAVEQGPESGVVEFRAHYETPAGPGVLHERSRFEKRGGRWVYLDGDDGRANSREDA